MTNTNEKIEIGDCVYTFTDNTLQGVQYRRVIEITQNEKGIFVKLSPQYDSEYHPEETTEYKIEDIYKDSNKFKDLLNKLKNRELEEINIKWDKFINHYSIKTYEIP